MTQIEPGETLHRSYWMTFTADMPLDQAAAEFKERYQREPEHYVVDKNLLWVGPVKQGVRVI